MQNAEKGEGKNLKGAKLRIGIVQARFNESITDTLYASCREELLALGVKAKNIDHVTVTGALEVPIALQALAIKREETVGGPVSDGGFSAGVLLLLVGVAGLGARYPGAHRRPRPAARARPACRLTVVPTPFFLFQAAPPRVASSVCAPGRLALTIFEVYHATHSTSERAVARPCQPVQLFRPCRRACRGPRRRA